MQCVIGMNIFANKKTSEEYFIICLQKEIRFQ